MSTMGTVLFKEGNFFVDVEGKHELIPVGHEDAPHLKQLVGKKVEVVFSEPTRFIAGLIPTEETLVKIVKVLCYIPAPDFRTAVVVGEHARIEIAKRMLDAGQLSKENFAKITAPQEMKRTA
ncbi:MAG: hypothetical protein LAN83_17325 [Acidobacteriia bacterium]|nr:hypothetical protein [Terriglobia bacterium]